MIDINFYQFKKDSNSTKRPEAETAAVFSCAIIEPSSIINPTVKLTANNIPFDYNYCYIPNFKRYYFVNDIVYNNGFWYVSMNIDVLATYKTEIGAENLYILRSSNAVTSGVRDNYYPMNGIITKERYTIRAQQSNTFSNGVYVVNVMGKQTGSSTLYQFTPQQFSALINKLMIQPDSFQWVDVVNAISNSMFKPMDYINSVLWFPEPFAATQYSGADLYIGWWLAQNMNYSIITDPVKRLTVTGLTPTIFKHPQQSRGKYLNFAPYTEINVEIPPFGIIPIDTTQVSEDTYITINIYVDALTGVAICRGETSESGDATLFNVSAQYGVQLPLLANGGSGTVSSLIGSIAGIAAGVATGGASGVATAIGSATAGIGSIESAITGASSSIGSNGSIVAHNMPRYLNARFFHVVDADNSKNGRPLMRDTTPASLGGFMMVQRGDVPINGTQFESEEIKRLLEAGFYYE